MISSARNELTTLLVEHGAPSGRRHQ
jgi:hypothetical protein